MFDKIGNKIKGLAITLFVIMALAFVIIGIAIIGDKLIVGLLCLLGGPILSWITSWILYGFGELISKVTNIENEICGNKRNSNRVSPVIDSRTKDIMELHAKGLLTDEEYERAMAKIGGNSQEEI